MASPPPGHGALSLHTDDEYVIQQNGRVLVRLRKMPASVAKWIQETCANVATVPTSAAEGVLGAADTEVPSERALINALPLVGKCLLASSIMLSAAVFSMSVAAAALLDARTESAIAEVCGRVGEENDVLSEGERAAALQGASVAALAVGVLAAGAVSAPGSFDGATWLTALYSRRATASALAFFPGALLVVLCVPLLAANAVALGRQASCSSTSYAPIGNPWDPITPAMLGLFGAVGAVFLAVHAYLAATHRPWLTAVVRKELKGQSPAALFPPRPGPAPVPYGRTPSALPTGTHTSRARRTQDGRQVPWYPSYDHSERQSAADPPQHTSWGAPDHASSEWRYDDDEESPRAPPPRRAHGRSGGGGKGRGRAGRGASEGGRLGLDREALDAIESMRMRRETSGSGPRDSRVGIYLVDGAAAGSLTRGGRRYEGTGAEGGGEDSGGGAVSPQRSGLATIPSTRSVHFSRRDGPERPGPAARLGGDRGGGAGLGQESESPSPAPPGPPVPPAPAAPPAQAVVQPAGAPGSPTLPGSPGSMVMMPGMPFPGIPFPGMPFPWGMMPPFAAGTPPPGAQAAGAPLAPGVGWPLSGWPDGASAPVAQAGSPGSPSIAPWALRQAPPSPNTAQREGWGVAQPPGTGRPDLGRGMPGPFQGHAAFAEALLQYQGADIGPSEAPTPARTSYTSYGEDGVLLRSYYAGRVPMQRRGRHAPVSVVPSTHELRPGMHSAAPSESNAALHHQDQFDGDPVSGVHMRGPWSVRSQSRSASGSGVHRRWQHKRDSAPAIMPREHFEGRDHVMRVQSAHGSSAVFQQVLVEEGAPRQRALHAAGSLDRAQAMDAAEEAAAVAAALLGGKGERGERGEGAARGGGKGEGGGEGRLGQGGVLVESDAEGEGAGVRGEGSVSGEDESEGGSGAPRPHGKGSGLPDEQSAFGSIMLESRSGRRLFHPEASTSDGESQGQSEREERSQVSSGRKSPMSDGGAGRAGANGGGGAYSSDSGARKKERGLDGTGSRGMALAGMGSFDFDGGRLPEEIAEGEREGEEGDEERVEEGEEGER